MKAEQLKRSILQNAIEGKLVEETNAGNSAKFLLDKIGERKGINLQHTSKTNSLNENNKSVVPFKIPDSWCWVKLSDISSIIIGKTPAKSEVDFWAFQDYKWVTIADMINGEVIYDTSLNISQEAYDRIFRGKIIKKGTLIMSFKLTIGKTSIMGFDGFHNEAIASIVPYYDEENTLRNYLLKILPLISQSGEFKGAIKGNTLNKKTLSNLPIPLPPLEDQKSIVEKLDEVFKVADEYDRLEKKIESLNNEFPLNMQKSILQSALEGNISKNTESDITTDELIDIIQCEKETFIKNNNIRKKPKLPPIDMSELPFKIPSTWKWVRVDDIANNIYAGGDKPKMFNKEKKDNYKVPVIANGKTNRGIVGYTDTAKEQNKSITVSGRGTIGYSIIRDSPFYPIVRLVVIVPSSQINIKYLELVLNHLLENGIGTSIKQLTVPMLRPKLIPLPPIEVQDQIVNRVELLFKSTHKMKNNLIEKL